MNEKKLPLNPNVELFRWGPIPGKYFFAAGDCVESFFTYIIQKYESDPWPDSLFLNKDGKLVWVGEFPPMWKEGQEIFLSKMLPDKERGKVFEEWKMKVNDLCNFEKNIDSHLLKDLDSPSLAKLIFGFYETLVAYWGPTFFPELGNYGAEHYLEGLLSAQIKERSEVLRVMEIITAPEEFSFYQMEEIELSTCIDISKHQQKYFWLKNNHNRVEVLLVSYFEGRKELLNQNLKTTLEKNLAATIEKKIQAQKEWGLTEAIMETGRVISNNIVWQDQRKMNTFISLHFKYLLLQEVSRRLDITEKDLFTITLYEMGELVSGKDFSTIFKDREQGVGVFCQKNSIQQLSATEVTEYWNLYAEDKFEIKNFESFSGTLVSKGSGNVQGKVQILLDPMAPFEEGSILVTSMTSPEYVFAMRKALAIITDTGGIGSHAAITSRELNKPCIVGTKVATKVLKDGDIVEIDTNKGIIKIMNNE